MNRSVNWFNSKALAKVPALHGFIIKEKISTRQKNSLFQSKLKKIYNFFLKDQKYLLLEYITEIKNKAKKKYNHKNITKWLKRW